MENVRIAVVEDDKNSADVLNEYIRRYGSEKNANFEVTVFSTVTDFLERFRNNYNILFLDIELPDGDGIKLAQSVRNRDSEVIIVFVTNMAQYAVKGYEVHAFDFIVKPITYENFCVKFASELDYYRSRKSVDVWISNKDGKRRLSASRIKYVEVSQHMLVYHTLDGDFNASGSLADAEAELKDAAFALCNRCYLVNLRYVTEVRQYSVIVGGDELQISRLKRGAFMQTLTNFLAGC